MTIKLTPGPCEDRRSARTSALLHQIWELKGHGLTNQVIAARLQLSSEYVRQIVHLAATGEVQLLALIEAGELPLSVALQVDRLDDAADRKLLLDAYRSGRARGQAVVALARALANRRRSEGASTPIGETEANRLVHTVGRDARSARAEDARTRLAALTAAFEKLMEDPEFVDVLVEQGIETVPQQIVRKR